MNLSLIEIVPLAITAATFISLRFVKQVMYPNRVLWIIFAVGGVLGFLIDWIYALACGALFGAFNTVIPHLNKPMTWKMIDAEYAKHEGEGGYLYGLFAGSTCFFIYALLSRLLEIGPMWSPILS